MSSSLDSIKSADLSNQSLDSNSGDHSFSESHKNNFLRENRTKIVPLKKKKSIFERMGDLIGPVKEEKETNDSAELYGNKTKRLRRKYFRRNYVKKIASKRLEGKVGYIKRPKKVSRTARKTVSKYHFFRFH